MKKSIALFSVISVCLFTAALFFAWPLHGEFKFKEFKSEKERFERYTEKADSKTGEQDWQDIIDSGKQEMLADWEKSAETEKERYVRQGFSGDEVKASLEEAKAQWESDFERAEARAKGAWYLKREKLVLEETDFSELKNKVKDASEESADVPAWDSYVKNSLDGVNSGWDEKYIPVIENLKSRGALLTGEEKAGFDAELAEFEKSLRQKFEVERDTILYTGRNLFITELYVDTESLKYKSESESADTVTDNVIEEVQAGIKSEEEKILNRKYSGEGVSTIDFSSMGDDWQEELKRLVNIGMEKWNSALDKLYQKMLSWKQSAEEAYATAEAMWRKAAEKLEKAKLEWEKKLSNEIYMALDSWKKEESDLAENIERSRMDFAGYMENLSNQWNDHTSGLIDMAVSGSKIYTESLENIRWLQKMCDDNANSGRGAFSVKGSAVHGLMEGEGFWSILEQSEKDNVTGTISSQPGTDSLFSRYGISFAEHKIEKGIYQNCWYDEFTSSCEIDDSNPMNSHLGEYYYDPSGGYYTQEYAGAQEKQDGDGNWYLTETYTVKVYGKKMTYQATPTGERTGGPFSPGDEYYYYSWHESTVLLKTFQITNDVTDSSPDSHKSSYYYYKTELARWKNISTSFKNIASDAELYMHEKNMLGQDGPGYLDNAGGSDPYLMTDAEFSLEIAERDRDFWQKRLDIAKAVLDYAESAKKDSALSTEQKKTESENRMKDAKSAYETALAGVKTIVDSLKLLQGQKPSTVYDPLNVTDEWKQYTSSIEYLTKEYTKANTVLAASEDKYTQIKRALILLENSENAEYLVKEIGELEKKIVESDRDLYLKNTEFFTKQMESEYANRTAGFAADYETAVKKYETENWKFGILKGILAGQENDSALTAWSAGIIAAKDKLWSENGDQYCSALQALVDGFNAASGDEKNIKREKLSSYIRGIYFTLQGNTDSSWLIVSKLRDGSFDPDAFMKEAYTEDHGIYKKYAETSVNALNIVKNAFTWGESNGKSYDAMLSWLRTEFDKEHYIYGADNSSWMEHYTALKYFEDRYRGLTAEAWESSRYRLDLDMKYSGKAAELHDDMSSMTAEELASLVSENENRASTGDMDAVAWLREYYMSGSGIAGIEFIQQADSRAAISRNSYETLKSYVYDNYSYFQKDQELFAGHNYLQDALGYINSIVSLAVTGENPFSIDAFRNLNPENMSLAAGALIEYTEKLEKSGVPLPDFLKTAAASAAQMKEKLDRALFIYRYMKSETSDEMAGTVDDVYSRKLTEASVTQRVMEFIQGCGDIIEAGTGGDYTSAMNMLSLYETLSENEKKYIEENSSAKIRGVDAFVKELYLYKYTLNINTLAADYEKSAVTPEQYADLTGLTGDARVRLMALIKPVYNRKSYDTALAEGRVTDIRSYITSMGLDSNSENSLLSYALVKDFLSKNPSGNVTKGEFTGLDYEVKVYAASKYFYDEVFVKNKIMKTGIEEFLEDRFGEGSVSSGLVSEVEKYAGRLNAITMYYGSDIKTYTSSLDPDAAQYFLMYLNGADSSILPCFEYGIYGSGIAGAAVYAELGKLTACLDKYMSGYQDAAEIQQKNMNTAQAGLRNAEALRAFYAAGENEIHWRDSLIAVTEKTEEGEDKKIITLQLLDDLAGWFDSFNSETGIKDVLVYSGSKVSRDGKNFSINEVIDEMNKISSVFTALGRSLKDGVNTGDTKSIAEFLSQSEGIYSFGTGYTPDASGSFSFESALSGLVSGYGTDSADLNSRVSILAGEISGLESGMGGYKTTLASKKASYDLLGGKRKEELLAELEKSRIEHEQAKRAVEAASTLLTDARTKYEQANSSYVSQMNNVSSLYNTYKAYEYDYEKAYSVWEYANTPYLKQAETDAGSTGQGQTVEGGTADYGTISVPDARDNYARILVKYNEVKAVYDKKAEAVSSQENVEKLNLDAQYAKLKSDFVRVSETYIRTAQVDYEVKEDLEQYKNDYNISQKAYENAKDSVTFFVTKNAELADEAQKTALKELRDKLLAHILKTGTGGEAVIAAYMNGLAWYSCVKSTESYNNSIANYEYLISLTADVDLISAYQAQIYDLRERIKSNNLKTSAFNGLTDEMRTDIKTIYDSFNTGTDGDCLNKILQNYDNYVYWHDMYEEADHTYHNTSKWNYFKRRKWKRIRNDREEKYKKYYSRYDSGRDSIYNTLTEALAKKNDYSQKSAAYTAISSARYLDDIKAYLKQGQYGLTDEDLGHIYDSTSTGFTPDAESINLELLRSETERKDMDGAGVSAKVIGGKIVVLDKDGKETAEVYDLKDASVKLKLGGENVASYEEGNTYQFYDRTYSIASVTGVLKEHSKSVRQDYYIAMMNYASQSVTDGKHDNTVILKDLESTYHGLQETAVNFNSGTVDAKGNPIETGQRGFEGYTTITKEYVNNGNETSIQGMIVQALIQQNTALQNQLWSQQWAKFQERKDRWKEVAGYILNRGTQEWRENYAAFRAQWAKWRFDAKKMIEDGEKWWVDLKNSITGDMNTWAEGTSKAATKEAAQKIYEDLASQTGKYEESIKNRTGLDFNIDTESILARAMRNKPADSIGILSMSMKNTDTTAGFTSMLNLGLSGSLFKYNEKQMEQYTDAIGTMKNLQMIDILNSIIDGFNTQLTKANESVFKGVQSNIAGSETFCVAPFERKKDESRWEIEVCTESNLTGDKYKTRRFADYGYYLNTTVFLKPVKGLNGAKIDFTQANTYSNIDADDLETYVGLESEWLNRSIDEIFREDGAFSSHQEKEYNRLFDRFGKYYGEWMAGEAMKGGAFYSKPMFPNGPNMLQTVAIAASLTGQPWMSVLVTLATSAIQVADGTMSWKQAGFQVGMSIATAAIGSGAGKLGEMAGATGSFTNIAVKATASTVGNTLLSGVSLEGGGLSYDKDRMTSMKTWTSAGINIATAIVANQYCSNDLSKALVNGVGNGISGGVVTGNWKESMTNSMRNSFASYLAGKAGGLLSSTTGLGGDAIDNFLNYGMRKMLGSNEKFSWDMIAKNNAIEKLAGEYFDEALMSDDQKAERDRMARQDAENQKNSKNAADKMNSVDDAIAGIFLSIRNDITGTIQDAGHVADDIGAGFKYAANITGKFGEMTGNLFTQGQFAMDWEIRQKLQRQELDGMIGFDLGYLLDNKDINENGGQGNTIGNGFIKDKNEVEQKTKDSSSPKGKVVTKEYFEGDPDTKVNVKGKDVPSQPGWVEIMDYGNAEKHPEQWTEMDDFSDKKHYGDKDDPRKVDLDSSYNNGNGMTWYGPNAQFIVDDVNIGGNLNQGTSVRLSILDSEGNISGKVELGHLTEINKDLYNAEKGVTVFDAGTILGKTNRIIGCSTGLHLHMYNMWGKRNELYRLMSGRE